MGSWLVPWHSVWRNAFIIAQFQPLQNFYICPCPTYLKVVYRPHSRHLREIRIEHHELRCIFIEQMKIMWVCFSIFCECRWHGSLRVRRVVVGVEQDTSFETVCEQPRNENFPYTHIPSTSCPWWPLSRMCVNEWKRRGYVIGSNLQHFIDKCDGESLLGFRRDTEIIFHEVEDNLLFYLTSKFLNASFCFRKTFGNGLST